MPAFLNRPNNVTAVVGSDVILPCAIKNLGPKSVVWRKTTKPNPISIGEFVFDPDKRYSVNRSDRFIDSRSNSFIHVNPVWNLLVTNVDFHHAGTYQCQISTLETISRNITLNVVDGSQFPVPPHSHPILSAEDHSPPIKAPKGISLTGTDYAEKGAVIDLNCTATAIDYRPKGLDWFKDGTRLKQGGRRLITDQYMGDANVVHSRLEIQRVTMSDAGTYVCRFSQQHVESIKVIVLNTESSNKRRGTDDDPESERSDNHRDEDFYGPESSHRKHSDRDTAHISCPSLMVSFCLASLALVLT
ncbi:roundabout-like protein 1 [Plakobranchus ocellatus]|uniref:Roundabout-like protein 1 n=1 Tax=Plakobranchus ocellatus TaxID=259542 RepID=A0AAV4DKR2_9GAST|nr:roundabout-like protein 1 [Plakobranchus ocellatus]